MSFIIYAGPNFQYMDLMTMRVANVPILIEIQCMYWQFGPIHTYQNFFSQYDNAFD